MSHHADVVYFFLVKYFTHTKIYIMAINVLKLWVLICKPLSLTEEPGKSGETPSFGTPPRVLVAEYPSPGCEELSAVKGVSGSQEGEEVNGPLPD